MVNSVQAGGCVSQAITHEKWDRHECLSHLKVSSNGPCIAISNPQTRATASSCAERSPLLKAFAAKDRTSLGGAEGNGRFLSALGTSGLRFRAHLRSSAASRSAFCAFGFAALAPLRLVLKTLVGKKHLFAGSKNKFSAAFRTLQDPIVVFHEPLSRCPEAVKEMGTFRTMGQVI